MIHKVQCRMKLNFLFIKEFKFLTLLLCILLSYFCRNNSPDSLGSDKDSRSLSISMNSSYTARDLFKLVVPLIKAEASDVRETAITGLGNIHPSSFRYKDIVIFNFNFSVLF